MADGYKDDAAWAARVEDRLRRLESRRDPPQLSGGYGVPGPGPNGVPDAIFWWEADDAGASYEDGDIVSFWRSKVGGYVAFSAFEIPGFGSLDQPIYRATAIGGKPAIEFDGHDVGEDPIPGTQFWTTDILLNIDVLEMYVLWRLDTLFTTAGGIIIVESGLTEAADNYFGFSTDHQAFAAPDVIYSAAHYQTNGAVWTANIQPLALGTPYLSHARFKLTGPELDVNNASSSGGSGGGGNTAKFASNKLWFGRRDPTSGHATSNPTFEGVIAAIVGFNRELTTTERSQVWNYFNDKYSLV